ncbi:MAG: class I SAM-dependent methyltransferase [Ignavibacteria bacterium]|nr:class I SAM-dependent methyltransferase [Ignavibacteria bacterium]
MECKYKYNEATVRFYDVVYEDFGHLKKGLEFYSQEIGKASGAVLEVGAGTGRILIPALRQGADIYGIDQSELMIEKLKGKLDPAEHKRISLQDARSFKLEKKFKLIISPFRVFQHLLTTEDQLLALCRIYDHLDAGGYFIFDLFRPGLIRLVNEVKDSLEFEGEYEKGKKLKRYYSVKPDYLNQVQNVEFRFVWDEDGEEKTSTYAFPMRYYFRFEVEHLIARSGFKLEHIYGDFEKHELNSKSNEFVIVCRK